MALRQLLDFLKPFEKISHSENAIEEHASRWCEEYFHTHPHELSIEAKRSQLFITSTNSTLKNSIFLNQEKLLADLKKKFGRRAPTVISFK